jgi:coproporphyrinogen III oxidase-like Fe-S oxidoreductase
MGVETFQSDTLKAVKRAKANERLIEKVVCEAQKLGITVNVDLMVGLPRQSSEGCLKDAETIVSIGPDQVTLYPYLIIPGVVADPGMSLQSMFSVIESAWNIFREYGYRRDSIWVFSKSQRIYDSAKDELVCDYFGLGPAAFSTCGNVQIVNPPIEIYLQMIKNKKRLVFYTELDEKAKVWRAFAHELYKLQLNQKFAVNCL